MKILFIRHAETQINVEGLMHKTGEPVGLTDFGKKQAESLVSACLEHKVEYVFSSPEERSTETAKIISKGVNKEVEILATLIERNWGDWEGQAWPDIEKHIDKMNLEERYNFVPPKGESWSQMEARLRAALAYITKKNYKVVAIITHEGALRGFMPILLNLPKEESFKYHFENAEVKFFEFINGVFTETI